MNWRLSALDNVTLVSNSDAHSLDNLGREANVLERKEGMTYGRLRKIIQRKEQNGFLYTIEFYPEEGKYHLDGHSACGVRLTPEETLHAGGRCPSCRKLITVGVLSRVEELADRSTNEAVGRIPFKNIVPLREVIAETLDMGKHTKRVNSIYTSLVPSLGTEFELLLHVPIEAFTRAGFGNVAAAIEKVRCGDLVISPGYDGVFGQVRIFKEGERSADAQLSLFG